MKCTHNAPILSNPLLVPPILADAVPSEKHLQCVPVTSTVQHHADKNGGG
jgi:hypothetical protein